MLPEKTWKMDATARLFASVVICWFFLGQLVNSLIRYLNQSNREHVGGIVAGTAGAFVLFAGAVWLLARPWRYETLVRKLAGLCGCIYGGFFAAWYALNLQNGHEGRESSTVTILVAVLSFQGAALVLTHGFLREHGTTWDDAFGFETETPGAILRAVLIAICILPIGWGLQLWSGYILEFFHVRHEEQTAIQMLRATTPWLNRAVLAIVTIAIAPVAEEILFRGILYPGIKRSGHPRLALWSTAILFGAIHVNLVTFVPLTVLALALTWLYEKTGNLLAPIVTHSLFNAANFALLYWNEASSRLPAHS